MKEYIRTTHNFNNETRKWICREDEGQDKHLEWNSPAVRQECFFKDSFSWSLGLHALSESYWMDINWIVDENIKMVNAGAIDTFEDFDKFIKDNPNYKELIKEMILKDLEIFIKYDMVRVREKK